MGRLVEGSMTFLRMLVRREFESDGEVHGLALV